MYDEFCFVWCHRECGRADDIAYHGQGIRGNWLCDWEIRGRLRKKMSDRSKGNQRRARLTFKHTTHVEKLVVSEDMLVDTMIV